MNQVEIHEAGVLLRPWRPGDAEAVHEACQDPDIQRWTSFTIEGVARAGCVQRGRLHDAWIGSLLPGEV